MGSCSRREGPWSLDVWGAKVLGKIPRSLGVCFASCLCRITVTGLVKIIALRYGHARESAHARIESLSRIRACRSKWYLIYETGMSGNAHGTVVNHPPHLKYNTHTKDRRHLREDFAVRSSGSI